LLYPSHWFTTFCWDFEGEGITGADEHGITGADELQLVITVGVPNTSGQWEFSGIL